MTKELCKQLEDAGFVQTLPTPQGKYIHDHTVDPSFHYYRPTLSELIEACGDEILGLNRTHDDLGNPNGWVADTHTKQCDCGKTNCFGFNWEHEAGKTPEEAVAKLWLALLAHTK